MYLLYLRLANIRPADYSFYVSNMQPEKNGSREHQTDPPTWREMNTDVRICLNFQTLTARPRSIVA